MERMDVLSRDVFNNCSGWGYARRKHCYGCEHTRAIGGRGWWIEQHPSREKVVVQNLLQPSQITACTHQHRSRHHVVALDSSHVSADHRLAKPAQPQAGGVCADAGWFLQHNAGAVACRCVLGRVVVLAACCLTAMALARVAGFCYTPTRIHTNTSQHDSVCTTDGGNCCQAAHGRGQAKLQASRTHG